MHAALATTGFQSAYQQISAPERSFVDWLVHEIAEAARRLGQRISLALSRPLPEAVVRRDTHGWLQRPLVRAAIHERIQAEDEAQEISPRSWIREVHAIAHSDAISAMKIDEYGLPYVDLESITEDQRRAIKDITIEAEGGEWSRKKVRLTIKMHDKLAALKMEAAYLGLDDGDNPHRRADRAAAQQAALPAGVSDTAAADAYARMIGDGE